jgi:hypothetical protein
MMQLFSKFIALLLVAAALVPSTTNGFSLTLLKIKGKSGVKKMVRLLRREPEAKPDNFPLNVKNDALTMPPKPRKVEAQLQEKYAAIDDLEERAFQILLDLGMVGNN